MHLNDDQLLETDEFSALHLSQCKDCQRRADNLLKLRNKLNQLPSEGLVSGSWEKLKYTYQVRTDEIKQEQNNKQIKRWKLSATALAASLILAVIFPRTLVPGIDASSQYQQLTLLVEQNNLLQQQLIKLKPGIVTDPVKFNLIRYQLSALDQYIQSAHIEHRSIEEKSELWSHRQKLLKQWLTKKTSTNTLSI
jgi:hypothetical protein